MNIYEKAIFEICKVLQKYSHDEKFAVYGFGGVPQYTDDKGQIKPELKKDLNEHLDRQSWAKYHEENSESQVIYNSDEEENKATDMSEGITSTSRRRSKSRPPPNKN